MYKDREHAGRELAKALATYKNKNTIVLGLPRGGVPLAYEIANSLHLPLDVLVVRKIGAPWNPEFGVGAIAEDVLIFDQDSLNVTGLTPDQLKSVVERERDELHRRNKLYRGKTPFPDLKGKTVILVDDGLATGVTTRAAIQAIRAMHPDKLVLAVPVGPKDTVESLKGLVDQMICLQTPSYFMAVGAYYDWFPQVSDTEVIELLANVK